jgi:hypothetical protein
METLERIRSDSTSVKWLLGPSCEILWAGLAGIIGTWFLALSNFHLLLPDKKSY